MVWSHGHGSEAYIGIYANGKQRYRQSPLRFVITTLLLVLVRGIQCNVQVQYKYTTGTGTYEYVRLTVQVDYS